MYVQCFRLFRPNSYSVGPGCPSRPAFRPGSSLPAPPQTLRPHQEAAVDHGPAASASAHGQLHGSTETNSIQKRESDAEAGILEKRI